MKERENGESSSGKRMVIATPTAVGPASTKRESAERVRRAGEGSEERADKGRGVYRSGREKAAEKQTRLPQDFVRGTGTVLLIDDEENLLAVSKILLEGLGYSVLTAKSGRDGVALFNEKHAVIDVVILDVFMPDMGGEEVFDKLQAVNSGVPIIASSGFDMNEPVSRLMEKGCKTYIQKPYNIAEFSRHLRAVIDASSRQGASVNRKAG